MNHLLRLSLLVFAFLFPLVGQTASVFTDQSVDSALVNLLDVAADEAPLNVIHCLVTEDRTPWESREETQEEEEEEPSYFGKAVAFQYPLLAAQPEWNDFVLHPCGPPLFKRYLYFHALKLDC